MCRKVYQSAPSLHPHHNVCNYSQDVCDRYTCLQTHSSVLQYVSIQVYLSFMYLMILVCTCIRLWFTNCSTRVLKVKWIKWFLYRLHYENKANLRDLIAATGLEILLKFDPNHRFSARLTLKFDVWPRKMIGHLFYTTSSFVYHFKSIGEFKLKLHSGNAQFGSKSAIFCPLWPWNLMDNLEKQ